MILDNKQNTLIHYRIGFNTAHDWLVAHGMPPEICVNLSKFEDGERRDVLIIDGAISFHSLRSKKLATSSPPRVIYKSSHVGVNTSCRAACDDDFLISRFGFLVSDRLNEPSFLSSITHFSRAGLAKNEYSPASPQKYKGTYKIRR